MLLDVSVERAEKLPYDPTMLSARAGLANGSAAYQFEPVRLLFREPLEIVQRQQLAR